jgi:putative transposase
LKVREDKKVQSVAVIVAVGVRDDEYREILGTWVTYERIPVKTPNLNAYIEAFHLILEDDCYSRYDFASFLEAYKTISEYMTYYNHRCHHGSIGNMAPVKFHAAFLSKKVKAKPISA